MNGHRALIPEKNGKQTTPKDFIVEPITLRKGLVGAKPEKVCRWILDLLNARPGDEVVDLYPGTGVMGRVAEEVCREAIGSIASASLAEYSIYD
jgi:DNA modification methylase